MGGACLGGCARLPAGSAQPSVRAARPAWRRPHPCSHRPPAFRSGTRPCRRAPDGRLRRAHQLDAVAAAGEARARRDRRGADQGIGGGQVPRPRRRVPDQGDHGWRHPRSADRPPPRDGATTARGASPGSRHGRLLGPGARVPTARGGSRSAGCQPSTTRSPRRAHGPPRRAVRRLRSEGRARRGAFHDNAMSRERDAERDLDTLVVDESLTVRLTYGQVFDRGCETIAKVAALLRRRGWPGTFVRCPDCP